MVLRDHTWESRPSPGPPNAPRPLHHAEIPPAGTPERANTQKPTPRFAPSRENHETKARGRHIGTPAKAKDFAGWLLGAPAKPPGFVGNTIRGPRRTAGSTGYIPGAPAKAQLSWGDYPGPPRKRSFRGVITRGPRGTEFRGVHYPGSPRNAVPWGGYRGVEQSGSSSGS